MCAVGRRPTRTRQTTKMDRCLEHSRTIWRNECVTWTVLPHTHVLRSCMRKSQTLALRKVSPHGCKSRQQLCWDLWRHSNEEGRSNTSIDGVCDVHKCDFFTFEKQPFSKWQRATLFVSCSVVTRAAATIYGVCVCWVVA